MSIWPVGTSTVISLCIGCGREAKPSNSGNRCLDCGDEGRFCRYEIAVKEEGMLLRLDLEDPELAVERLAVLQRLAECRYGWSYFAPAQAPALDSLAALGLVVRIDPRPGYTLTRAGIRLVRAIWPQCAANQGEAPVFEFADDFHITHLSSSNERGAS